MANFICSQPEDSYGCGYNSNYNNPASTINNYGYSTGCNTCGCREENSCGCTNNSSSNNCTVTRTNNCITDNGYMSGYCTLFCVIIALLVIIFINQ